MSFHDLSWCTLAIFHPWWTVFYLQEGLEQGCSGSCLHRGEWEQDVPELSSHQPLHWKQEFNDLGAACFGCALLFWSRHWHFYWGRKHFWPPQMLPWNSSLCGIFPFREKQVDVTGIADSDCIVLRLCIDCDCIVLRTKGIIHDPVWKWQLFYTVVAPRQPLSWHC